MKNKIVVFVTLFIGLFLLSGCIGQFELDQHREDTKTDSKPIPIIIR